MESKILGGGRHIVILLVLGIYGLFNMVFDCL